MALVPPLAPAVSRRRVGIEDLWPGSIRATEAGPVCSRQVRCRAESGPIDVSRPDGARISFPWLPRWWEAGDVDLARVLFLDTETTGLHGGTGTYAFVVGLGHFDGPDFVVEQYFLRDLGEERALLTALNAAWPSFETLVTYNGRAFDVPLLQTRYVMHRLPCRIDPDQHLDLLAPARRLWRRRIESCALTNVERHVFGAIRHGDVPGALIPTLYFQYLRRPDVRLLAPVFEHNVRDVIALAAVAVRLARLSRGTGGELDLGASALHPLEALSVGLLLRERGDLAAACRYVEMALEGQLPSQHAWDAYLVLASMYKRQGKYGEAAAVWQQVAQARSFEGLVAAIELAKYLEHHSRAVDAATRVVAAALARARAMTDHELEIRAIAASLEHRLRRLERKADRARRLGIDATTER